MYDDPTAGPLTILDTEETGLTGPGGKAREYTPFAPGFEEVVLPDFTSRVFRGAEENAPNAMSPDWTTYVYPDQTFTLNVNGEPVFTGVGRAGLTEAAKLAQQFDPGTTKWTLNSGGSAMGGLAPSTFAGDIVQPNLAGEFTDLVLPIVAAAIPGLGLPLAALAAAGGSGVSSALQGRSLEDALLRAAIAGGATYAGGSLFGGGASGSGQATSPLDQLLNTPALTSPLTGSEIASLTGTALPSISSGAVSSALGSALPSVGGDIIVSGALPSIIGSTAGAGLGAGLGGLGGNLVSGIGSDFADNFTDLNTGENVINVTGEAPVAPPVDAGAAVGGGLGSIADGFTTPSGENVINVTGETQTPTVDQTAPTGGLGSIVDGFTTPSGENVINVTGETQTPTVDQTAPTGGLGGLTDNFTDPLTGENTINVIDQTQPPQVDDTGALAGATAPIITGGLTDNTMILTGETQTPPAEQNPPVVTPPITTPPATPPTTDVPKDISNPPKTDVTDNGTGGGGGGGGGLDLTTLLPLLPGLLENLIKGGGSSGGATLAPGTSLGALSPTFSATLPSATLPGLAARTPRKMPEQDWTRYAFGPEQSFFSNVPMALAKGGALPDGRSDDIPAMLSNNEYVIDAETMALLGNGDPAAGAAKMDEWRVNVRKHKGRDLAKGKISRNAKMPSAYMGGGRI